MSDFNVRSIGDHDVLAPLLRQLLAVGAVDTPYSPRLVLVGSSSIAHADGLLVNLQPRLRRRAVIVGLDEHLDFGFVPGSHTELLARMQVLGSLPRDCAATPVIESFIGARGTGEGLARLVGAGYWKLGPAFHKVWHDLPPISAGAFLMRLVEAVELDGSWFEEPPVSYCY